MESASWLRRSLFRAVVTGRGKLAPNMAFSIDSRTPVLVYEGKQFNTNKSTRATSRALVAWRLLSTAESRELWMGRLAVIRRTPRPGDGRSGNPRSADPALRDRERRGEVVRRGSAAGPPAPRPMILRARIPGARNHGGSGTRESRELSLDKSNLAPSQNPDVLDLRRGETAMKYDRFTAPH